MIRRCFQTGCLFKKGKRRKTWVARWRESVIQPDGTTKRVLRAQVLGLVNEISEREARNKVGVLLRPIIRAWSASNLTTQFATLQLLLWRELSVRLFDDAPGKVIQVYA
jgi:hypothetical protein